MDANNEAGRDELFGEAHRKALDFLARRTHCAAELRIKLGRRYESDVITRVLDRLKEQEFLDDGRFVAEYAASRLARSPRSLNFLRREIREKGVDSETVDSALGAYIEEKDLTDNELAFQAARRKLPLLHADSDEKLREKLLRFLASRGFDYGSSKAAAEKLIDWNKP